MYEHGEGVPQSYARAAALYQGSAIQGYGPAQASLGAFYDLGLGVNQDIIHAYVWSELAAEQMDAAGVQRESVLRTKLDAAQTAEAKRRIAEYKSKFATQ